MARNFFFLTHHRRRHRRLAQNSTATMTMTANKRQTAYIASRWFVGREKYKNVKKTYEKNSQTEKKRSTISPSFVSRFQIHTATLASQRSAKRAQGEDCRVVVDVRAQESNFLVYFWWLSWSSAHSIISWFKLRVRPRSLAATSGFELTMNFNTVHTQETTSTKQQQ